MYVYVCVCVCKIHVHTHTHTHRVIFFYTLYEVLLSSRVSGLALGPTQLFV